MKKLTKLLLLAIAAICATNSTASAQRTISGGNYDDPSIWDNNQVPQNGDDIEVEHFVIAYDRVRAQSIEIKNGGYLYTVSNQTTRVDGDLVIDAGGVLHNLQNSLVYGRYVVNGTHYSNDRIRLRNDGQIEGSGLVAGNFDFHLRLCSRTIPSDATLTFQTGTIRIDNNETVTNFGQVAVAIVTSSNSNGTWVNKTGAKVTVNNGFTDLRLIANEVDNEVIFTTDIGVDLLLIDPLNSEFYDLTIIGNGSTSTRIAQDYTVILGDLTINNAIYECYDGFFEVFNVYGDWIVNNGIFLYAQSTVNFKDTSAPQLINTTDAARFFNVNVDANVYTSVNNTLGVFNDLDIQGELDLNNGNNYNIYLGRNLTAANEWNLHSNEMILFGNAMQTLEADLKIYDLTLNNPVGATIGSRPVELINFMEFFEGDFYTNDMMVLRSDENRTAGIGTIPAANAVIGQVQYNRYFAPAADGWGQLSLPLQSKTWRDLDDDILTTGFEDADYYYGGWINILKYDESASGDLDQGFYGIGNLDELISPTEGHFVYYQNGAINIDATGAINQQDYTYDLTYTNNDATGNTGWNLLSNPYPCTIDWQKGNGWQKSNLSDAVYIYNAVTNQYSSFINGVGVNGGSRYIPSGQAFWVKSNAASPTLTINENAKANAQAAYRSEDEAPSYFTLKLSDENGSDQMAFATEFGATINFDTGKDAEKLFSGVNAINICSLTENEERLSINTFGEVGNTLQIPLQFAVPSVGSYILSAENIENFDGASCVHLLDAETQTTQPITEGMQLALEFDLLNYDTRYFLVFEPAFSVETEFATCAGEADATAVVSNADSENYTFAWTNETGEEIGTTANIANLNAGHYNVQITPISGGCVAKDVAVFIPETQGIVLNPIVQAPTCAGIENGQIAIATNENTTMEFAWQNGESGATLSNLAAGTYLVEATNQNGCTTTEEIVVPEGAVLQPNVMWTDPSCETSQDGSIILETIGGAAPYQFNWSDGALGDTRTNLAAGAYEVNISDSNGCNTTVVTSLLAGEQLQVGGDFELQWFENHVSVTFENWSEAGEYTWDFGDGNVSEEQNPTHNFEIGQLYTVLLTVENGACTNSMSFEINTTTNDVEQIQTEGLSTKRTGANDIQIANPTAQVYQVHIWNVLGQRVAASKTIQPGETLENIKIPSGVVVLHFENANGEIATQKIAG